jgi:HEAT repeat protein
MTTKQVSTVSLAVAAGAASSATLPSVAAATTSLEAFLRQLKSADDKARTEAWCAAGPLGAAAVQPLAALLTGADREVARAASRGLGKIAHYAGRPGAGAERKAVAAALSAALSAGQPAPARRELVWLLSEIGGDEAVPPVAALLSDPELRDDARMVLERLPGIKATAALKAALNQAPADFKPSLAHSLRRKGVAVKGVPDLRRIPTKATSLKPLA